MANFPPSPSLGELFTINNMTYRFNESGAWEVVITQSDESLVDVGVSTFESQAQFSGSSVAERLYHFSDNVDDSSGNDESATIGGASIPSTQYVTPTDLGYTNTSSQWVSTLSSGGFGKSIHIAGTSGTGTPMNFVGVPNPVFGTGEITIEFFVQFLSNAHNQTLFAWVDGTNGVGFYTNYDSPYGSSDPRKLSLWNKDAGTTHYCNWYLDWDDDLTKSKHYAIQRTADSGGYAQWDLYVDGVKRTHGGTHGTPVGNLQTVDVTGTEHFEFGSWPPSQVYQGNYYLDELRITKGLVYSGSTCTVPVVPFNNPVTGPPAVAGKALLYAKDVVVGGPEILLHLDDNLNDSSLNGHTVTGSNLQGYSASMSGFGKKLRLTKTSASYFHFPDPGIGTSDYTIEFWFHPVSQQTMALLNDGQATYGDWNIQFNYASGVHSIAFWDSIGGGSFITYTADLSGNGWYLGDLKHLAIVREDAGSSTSNIRIYFNGNYVPPNGASSSFPAATRSIGNSSTNWKFGTYPNASYYADGHVDDLRITKEALYFGTGVYNIPDAPFTLPTASKLHVMDSTGSEGVIS